MIEFRSQMNEIDLLDVAVDRSGVTHLSGAVKKTLSIAEAMVRSAGFEARIPVTKIIVSDFTDPEEGWTTVDLKIIVDCLPEQALAFWDLLGERVDTWLRGLPQNRARDFVQRFSMSVEWT